MDSTALMIWGTDVDPFEWRKDGDQGLPVITPDPYIPLGGSPLNAIASGQPNVMDLDPLQMLSYFGIASSDPMALAIKPGDDIPPCWAITHPEASPERVQYFDAARSLSLSELDIANLGRWEVVREQVGSMGAVCVDTLVGDLRVDALDSNGFVIQTTTVDGSGVAWADTEVLHPAANVDSLRWRWTLTVDGVSDPLRSTLTAFTAGSLGVSDPDVVATWPDARYGSRAPSQSSPQYISGGNCIIRLFVRIETDDPDRWRIKIAGRIGGTVQSPGPSGRALETVTKRRT